MTTIESATLPGYEEFAPALLVEKVGAVHVVRINRPEAFNAVDESVHHAFATIWRTLAADDDVRAVVTTGVGKAFSAGGDMVMFGRLIEDPVARQFQIHEARTVFLEVIGFPKPLVSAVNGPAVGLGCSLALLSDFMVMGESSFLSDPHVAVGLVAGDGGAAMLPLLIGLMKAKEYVLLGDRITAADAEKLNLVTKVVSDDDRLGRGPGDRREARRTAAAGAACHQGGDEHAPVARRARDPRVRAWPRNSSRSPPRSFRSAWRPSASGSRASVAHRPAHQVLHDLGGARVEALHARIAPQPGDLVFVDVAVATM